MKKIGRVIGKKGKKTWIRKGKRYEFICEMYQNVVERNKDSRYMKEHRVKYRGKDGTIRNDDNISCLKFEKTRGETSIITNAACWSNQNIWEGKKKKKKNRLSDDTSVEYNYH